MPRGSALGRSTIMDGDAQQNEYVVDIRHPSIDCASCFFFVVSVRIFGSSRSHHRLVGIILILLVRFGTSRNPSLLISFGLSLSHTSWWLYYL